ncbi:hypothetical protein BCR42DRAFT_444665 [Absidia repens]|uniref:Uncharacterized protein n=1 Tax=Absidia repens TaxID=90262 RepID=A0A1X2HK59_9FUNG|nr:hypothetical protein BCR42DRAFT_444665 [Absidia repens]
MSAATLAPTTTATSTSDYKQQPQEQPRQYDDNDDDDISLARFMSRKLQVNQQMPVTYPCMSPNFTMLQHHQEDPWIEKDTTPTNVNDYYGHNVSYAHYQQLQYQQQQQLILQCQKQNQMGYNGLSQKPHHHSHHHTSGTNHRSAARKTRPATADTHRDSKTRMTPSTSAPRVRSSTLNSSSSSSLATNASNSRQQQYQQRQRSSSPVPSLVDDSGTWRSSIYSHNSAASSSVKTTSDTTSFTNAPIHSSASSISSFTMSTSGSSNNKPSLSKRIRGVFSGANKQHYDSYSSTLRRSPSMVSCASSVMTTNTVSSSKSSWTNLFRKSSKSVSVSSSMDGQLRQASKNQRDSSVHGETKVVAPPSPASSISGRSHRHSTLRPKNEFDADLPSPASSSSTTIAAAPDTSCSSSSFSSSSRPASLLSSSSYSHQQQQQRYGGSRKKQIRSASPKIDSSSQQQDYFGLPSARHMARPTFLQHGSPGLRPASKSNTSLISECDDDDDISTCMMAPSDVVVGQQQHDGRKTTTTKTAPTFVSSGKKGAKTRFNTTIQVHDTFGSKDYDRRCDTQVTCHGLTPVLALQIKQELNEYKLNEMVVHSSSRQYTQFFL